MSEGSLRVAGRADATQTMDHPIAARAHVGASDDVTSVVEPVAATSLEGVAAIVALPPTPSTQFDTEPRHVPTVAPRTRGRTTVVVAAMGVAIAAAGAGLAFRNRASSSIVSASATAPPATSNVPTGTFIRANDVAAPPVPEGSAAIGKRRRALRRPRV